MSGQVLAGEFPTLPPTNSVYGDTIAGPTTGFTTGLTRVVPLQLQPTLVERWQIIGYSVRIRLGLAFFLPSGQIWGRLGQLWTGLVTDSSLTPANVATFPSDLSTFVKVWDGQNDDIREVNLNELNAGTANPLGYTLIAQTFMLPQPIEIRSGSQIQMALVLTPSMITTLTAAELVILRASYSVIYND